MRLVALPLFAAIATIALLVTLPWHWRARNVPTLSLILWLLLANLTVFVNAIVWSDSMVDYSAGLCDISIRIFIAASMAVPACSLAQMRRLESIASNRRTNVGGREKSRRIAGELALCVGSPLVMILAYISGQGHRYDISENLGCQPPIYYSWLSLTLILVVPLIVSVLAMLYAALALRCFIMKRLQFQAVLTSAQSGLTNSRFVRLICLAVVEGTLAVAGNIYMTARSIETVGIRPVQGWKEFHVDYNLIDQLPQDTSKYWEPVLLRNFLFPIYSFIFFALFGFGDEAVKEYLAVGRTILAFCKRGEPSRASGETYTLSASNLGTTIARADSKFKESHSDSGEAFQDLSLAGVHQSYLTSTALEKGGVGVKVETSVA